MFSFQIISIVSVIIVVLGLLIQRYWMDLLPIYKDLRYPILKNQIVEWKVSKKRNEKRDQNNQPNIILILADDLGFNDISFYGGGFYNGLVPTPNIDSIGKNGISFYQGYAGTPLPIIIITIIIIILVFYILITLFQSLQ